MTQKTQTLNQLLHHLKKQTPSPPRPQQCIFLIKKLQYRQDIQELFVFWMTYCFKWLLCLVGIFLNHLPPVTVLKLQLY